MDFFEKRRRIILTMYPLALSSHKTNHPYHDYRKNDINDSGLNSCIFVEVDDSCPPFIYNLTVLCFTCQIKEVMLREKEKRLPEKIKK